MSKFTAVVKTLAAAAAVLAASAAIATPILGTTNLTVGNVNVYPGFIDWNNTNPTSNVDAPPGPALGSAPSIGAFNVLGPQTGTLGAGLTIGHSGTIQDMNQTAGYADSFPLATMTSIKNFLTYSDEPNWIFTATYLYAGNVAGSPYSLTPLGNSTVVSIDLIGTVCDNSILGGGDGTATCSANASVSNWELTISTTFAGVNEQTLLGEFESGTLPDNSWSGTLVATAIPEPTSIALVGLALAGVGFVARRRKA